MSALPPVVGINLGNSYASIAVFTKERVTECIANQDGERQIACAIAFIGQEVVRAPRQIFFFTRANGAMRTVYRKSSKSPLG